MSDLRTAAQQALKVLEAGTDVDPIFAGETEAVLRAVLAQQAEPVEPHRWEGDNNIESPFNACMHKTYCMTLKQAEPLNLTDPAVQKRLATQWGYVPASAQAEPVEPVAWVGDPSTQDYASTQPEPDAYGYASRLAFAIWNKHYKDTAPQWKPFDDLMGVLTQIDNMTSGLTRLAQQDEPVLVQGELPPRYVARSPIQTEPVEPVAWNWMLDGLPYGRACYGDPPDADLAERAATAGRTVRLLYTAPPQRKLVPLTEEEIKTAFHAARNAKLGASQDNSRHRLSVIEIARAVEKTSWEKNHGQA